MPIGEQESYTHACSRQQAQHGLASQNALATTRRVSCQLVLQQIVDVCGKMYGPHVTPELWATLLAIYRNCDNACRSCSRSLTGAVRRSAPM